MEVTTRQHQDCPEWPYCYSLPGARVLPFSEGDLYVCVCVCGGGGYFTLSPLVVVYNTLTKLDPGAA